MSNVSLIHSRKGLRQKSQQILHFQIRPEAVRQPPADSWKTVTFNILCVVALFTQSSAFLFVWILFISLFSFYSFGAICWKSVNKDLHIVLVSSTPVYTHHSSIFHWIVEHILYYCYYFLLHILLYALWEWLNVSNSCLIYFAGRTQSRK